MGEVLSLEGTCWGHSGQSPLTRSLIDFSPRAIHVCVIHDRDYRIPLNTNLVIHFSEPSEGEEIYQKSLLLLLQEYTIYNSWYILTLLS